MILTSCKQVYWPWGGTTFSSPFISTLILSLMAPDTADLSVLLSAKDMPKGISHDKVHLTLVQFLPTCVLLKTFRKDIKKILFLIFDLISLDLNSWTCPTLDRHQNFRGLLSNQWTDMPEWNRDHIYRNKMTRIDWTGCNCMQFTRQLPNVQVWKLIHIHIINYI